MSVWVIAIEAARIAVKMPIPATRAMTCGALAKIGFARAMRYTPALTIVAAWIRAETGVGPSIASGSHTWSGNWALLPTAPARFVMNAFLLASAAVRLRYQNPISR